MKGYTQAARVFKCAHFVAIGKTYYLHIMRAASKVAVCGLNLTELLMIYWLSGGMQLVEISV